MESRHQKFAKIKRVLVSHGVLMEELSFTCGHRTCQLTGLLLKRDESEFSASELQQLLHEIMAITPKIASQLENWDLNGGQILKITRKHYAKNGSQFKTQKDVIIRLD